VEKHHSGWQYVFQTRSRSVDPRSGVTRRHHIDPIPVNKTIENKMHLQQDGNGVVSPLEDL